MAEPPAERYNECAWSLVHLRREDAMSDVAHFTLAQYELTAVPEPAALLKRP